MEDLPYSEGTLGKRLSLFGLIVSANFNEQNRFPFCCSPSPCPSPTGRGNRTPQRGILPTVLGKTQ